MTQKIEGRSDEHHHYSKRRRRARFGLLLVAALLIGALIALYIEYRGFEERQLLGVKNRLVELTAGAVGRLDSLAVEAQHSTDDVAREMTMHGGLISESKIDAFLVQMVKGKPHIFASGITYRPYGFSSGEKLYSKYFHRDGDGFQLERLDKIYDYLESEWYDSAIILGPRWSAPYYDPSADALIITYSSVFYGSDSKPLGVVNVDVSINHLRDILESLDLGPSGYPALTTRDGRYLYHPVTDYVTKGQTLADVAREKNDQTRIVMAEKVLRGEKGVLDHRSTTTGKEAWMIFAPVHSTGWSLQNTFLKDAVVTDHVGSRRRILTMLLFAIASLIVVVALISKAEDRNSGKLWGIAIFSSFLFASGIGVAWYVALKFTDIRVASLRSIVSRSAIDRVAKGYEVICRENNLEPPLFVPTGVELQSITFETPSDIVISGYIWQKYTISKHALLNRGFILSGASEFKLEEAFRQTIGDDELVRWRFEAKINEEIDYSKYPVDQADIAIRIVHKDLNHNVVLLPDLHSYKFTTPELKPGIDAEAFIPGWKIDRSFFSLEPRVKNTTYGEKESIAKQNFPILAFNVGIQRNFINAFISNLIPIIITLILLFMLLIIAHKIDTGRFMSICVGMFLVVVFSHVDVRNTISAQEVFYLEYFYFITYFFILLVTTCSIAITIPERFPFVKWRENLFAKLSYWPALTFSLFAVTIRVFF